MLIKIGIDIGGVISKYPELFKGLINAVCNVRHDSEDKVEVHIISDMHPKELMVDMLKQNGVDLPCGQIHSADYNKYGEGCKAELCRELGVTVLIDDFIGYVGLPGAPIVRLLVMPDASLPYYSDNWKTNGKEGDFGRRNYRKVSEKTQNANDGSSC